MEEFIEQQMKQVDLEPELAAYLDTSGPFAALRHPLVFAVPYFEMENWRLNKSLEVKKAILPEMISQRKYVQYVYLHERPYRVDAVNTLLATVGDAISDAEIRELLMGVWTDSENIWQNKEQWLELFEDHVPAMSEKDQAAFNAMPKQFTIYRGTFDGLEYGLSWTIDPEVAAFFAKRYRRDGEIPIIVEGKVNKSDVLFYTNIRNEKEIVVDPSNIIFD